MLPSMLRAGPKIIGRNSAGGNMREMQRVEENFPPVIWELYVAIAREEEDAKWKAIDDAV